MTSELAENRTVRRTQKSHVINTMSKASDVPQIETANTDRALSETPEISERQADVFVAGSLAIDLACDFVPVKGQNSSTSPKLRTSNPARLSQSLGGVGQNLATAIHYLGTAVQLCSVIGDDEAGASARKMLLAKGLLSSGIITKSSVQTAQYVAVNDAQKNLVLAMADMAILEGHHSEVDTVWKRHLNEHRPKWLVVDANWEPDNLKKWIVYGNAVNARIAFEPVSVAKSQRLFASSPDDGIEIGVLPNHMVSLATPNSLELSSMHTAAREAGLFERDDWWRVIDALGLSSSGSRDKLVSMTTASMVDEGIPQQTIQLLPYVPTILTKLGEKGVLMAQILRPGDDLLTSSAHSRNILTRSDIDHPTIGGVYMRLFPPAEIVPAEDIVSVNGVGDSFLGIIIAGLAKEEPKSLIDLIHTAQQGSVMTLKSKEAVSPEIRKLKDLI